MVRLLTGLRDQGAGAGGMAGGSRRKALWLAAFGASGLVAEGLTAYALRRAGE
mgnify:CR=1 FL=1